jgi:Mce-associated membrane protein
MLPKLPTSADPAGSEPRETAAAESVDAQEKPAPTESIAGRPTSGKPAAGKPADAKSTAGKPADAKPAADPARVRTLIVVGVVAVLLLAGAVLLFIGYHTARTTGALGNDAVVDASATAEVVGDVTAAVKTVYSYDYKTLDRNEADAKTVITGEFAGEFDRVFAPLKQLAPKEQAVLVTAVPAAGVTQLNGDHARLLMMVDQKGTRAGGQALPGSSARLAVEAARVDGRWKIAKVTPE